MKKILCILLTLVMCLGVLAGCGEPAAPAEEYNLAAAKLALEEAYKNYLVNPNSDYDLPAKSVIDGVSYEVTWTVDNENIKVTESSKKNYWTIDIPDANSTETTYKLTATIKAPNGETVTLELTRTLPIYNNGGIVTELKENTPYKMFIEQKSLYKTFFALTTTQDDENKFINTDVDAKKAADYYVEIVEGGYKFYTMVGETKTYVYAKTVTTGEGASAKTSKYIGFSTTEGSVFTYDNTLKMYFVEIDGYKYGVGTFGSYSTISLSEESRFNLNSVGSSQFVMGFMDKAYAESLSPSTGGYDDAQEITIAEAINLGSATADGTYTSQRYKITGVITSITDTSYGNLMISDGTNEFQIYGLYSEDGTAKYEALSYKPVVGDTITVVSGVGNYKGTPQMKNAWLVGCVKGEGGNQGGSVTAPEVTPVAPVAGSKYNLVLVKGGNYYVNGEMAATYYFGTTTTYADSVNFYVEETTGGYYLYGIIDGEKLYVNYKVSGTHVNSVYEATATTVYTYDDTIKTFKTTVQDGEIDGVYALGVSTEKTFTTVGPVNIANSNDYAVFVASTNNDQTGGTTEPDEPDTPDTPADPATGLEIGKGYTISATNGKGTIYVIGTVASGRFQGVYTAAEATVFYVEAATNANEYLLYFMDGTTKTYVVFGDSTTGSAITTNVAEATAFEWNTDKNTLAVAEDSNNRAFGVGATSTYDNFSAYDLTGAYNWGAFTPVEA